MARMEVKVDGPIACFVVTRRDGQELSLSSDRGSLIQWTDGGDCVKDFGSFHRDPLAFFSIVQDFLAEETCTGF